jgi:hypothetical protein
MRASHTTLERLDAQLATSVAADDVGAIRALRELGIAIDLHVVRVEQVVHGRSDARGRGDHAVERNGARSAARL